MNTKRFSTLLGLASIGAFAAAAFAGPSPQYWARPAPANPTPKQSTAACGGCKTTATWVNGERGPAGKGAPSATAVGTKHECSLCTGSIVTEKGTTSRSMTHAKAPCAQMACCK